MTLYEPQEDSFLLERWVRKLAKGSCLDMGTGTGIQAKAALEAGCGVLGADINPEAIAYCEKEIPSATFLLSDLFKDIPSQLFDTILFNAPYLPDEEKDADSALDGGKEGYELIARFLKEAKAFLAKEGRILLIFSSKTGKENVERELEKSSYTGKELEREHIFFEDLYCYEVRHA